MEKCSCTINNLNLGTPIQNFVDDMLTLLKWLDAGRGLDVYKFTKEELLEAQHETEDNQIEMMHEFMLCRRKATHTPEIMESM